MLVLRRSIPQNQLTSTYMRNLRMKISASQIRGYASTKQKRHEPSNKFESHVFSVFIFSCLVYPINISFIGLRILHLCQLRCLVPCSEQMHPPNRARNECIKDHPCTEQTHPMKRGLEQIPQIQKQARNKCIKAFSFCSQDIPM